jgi:subtilisin-like proprotein convertase family protein
MRGAISVAAIACACANAKITTDGGPSGDGASAAPDAQLIARSFTRGTDGALASDLPTLDDAVIASSGAVEPIAWYTGGLVAHASDTGAITDAATTTWAQVQAFPTTGKAAILWTTNLGWGSSIPPGVGLTDPNDFTVWAEGELYLDAGTWSFSLYADDHGFVELAPPGGTAFARVVSADYPTTGTGTFVAAAAGWYPFRYAISNHTGASGMVLQLGGPTTATAPIPREHVRARADHLAGLVETALDDSRGTGDAWSTIDATAPANVDWMMGMPADLGLTSSDTFTVRWSGQLRVDLAGSYQFHYATDDGQRLWLDGALVLDAWTDTVQSATTAPIALDPGWHDLVVDESENTSSAAAHLTFASGPELVGMPLPVDRLRPVEARSERVAPGTNHTHVNIPDLATIESDVTVDAPAAATVTRVDVAYQINHGNWGDLVVTLRAPDGTSAILRNRTDAGVSGDRIERFTVTTLGGAPAAGTWKLFVQDAASGSTGTLENFEVTPHHVGGSPPIPALAAAESQLHDLGDVVTIDQVSWTARTPTGTSVAVRVRTCADANACAAAPWSDALTAPGAPAVTPARWLQYRVELSSDGDHAAELDAIRVDYHTRD